MTIRITILLINLFITINVVGQHQGIPTVFVPNAFDTIDPTKIQKVQDAFVSSLVYEPLFQVDSFGEVVPVLAKSWKYNSKDRRITITIHSNHCFYDGSFVQSKDVVDSIKNFCLSRPGNLSSLYRSIAGCNDARDYKAEIRELDAQKLEIKINTTPSSFLYRLSSEVVGVFKKKNDKLLGSGPYKVKLLSNENLELVANPFFHDRLYVKNKGIKFLFSPEKDTQQNLLKYKPAGSVMLLSYMGGKYDMKEYNKFTHIPYITQSLILNPNIYPLNNAELRKTIQADLYNDGRLHECGSSIYQSYGFIPNGIGGSFVDLPKRLKIEKVNSSLSALLNQLKNNPVHLKIYRHLGRKSKCEELRINKIFKKYHILTEFQYLTDYKRLFDLYKDDTTQAYIELFVFLLRDSSKMLYRFASNSVNQNLFYWTSDEINSLLKQASKKNTLRERFPLFREINKIIHSNANVIELYYVGHTNYFHNCYQVDQPEISFSPNSFYLLKSLHYKKNCSIKK